MNLGLLGTTAKKLVEFSVKNSPAILTCFAVGGVIGTAVSTANAVIESRDYIRAHEMDEELKVEKIEQTVNAAGEKYEDHFVYYRQRTFAEKVKLTWKIWIVPIFIGGSTIGCIIGSNRISTKRNLALAAAYSMSEEAAKEFRDKVTDMMGEKKVEKIDNAIMQDKITNQPVLEENITHTQHGDQLMYDSWSGRYFRSGQNEVEKKVNMLNKSMMVHCEDSYVNDYYELIGLPSVPMGEKFGWPFKFKDKNPDVTVKFYPAMSNQGEPCIGVKIEPVLLKADRW